MLQTPPTQGSASLFTVRDYEARFVVVCREVVWHLNWEWRTRYSLRLHHCSKRLFYRLNHLATVSVHVRPHESESNHRSKTRGADDSPDSPNGVSIPCDALIFPN